MVSKGGGGAAPTGCYKCGRPGHWSRDCPSTPNPTPSSSTNPNPDSSVNPTALKGNSHLKQKPPRRSRPKLTPDLLLSDTTGIGYILRYFPPAFKSGGRGHELNDLRHLLCLYAEWHKRLLPYYDFPQFIHKVEQVGATKRAKVCLRELRERVANGLDPMKLQEPQIQQNSIDEGGLDLPSQFQENDLPNDDGINFHEDMPQGTWEKATEEMHAGDVNKIGISEEENARMEANRLKALERAAARRSRVSAATTT